MFGNFSSDDLLEHEITPILKMIDLGGVEMRATPTMYAWNAAIQKLLAFLPQVSSNHLISQGHGLWIALLLTCTCFQRS